MRKKKHVPAPTKQTRINIKGKGTITVNYDIPEISVEEYDAEIKRIEESIARIRKMQYSTNVALHRVQSRKLREITAMQLAQLLENGKMQKKQKAKYLSSIKSSR